ncbi:hypothetical protein [Anaerotignum sp.]
MEMRKKEDRLVAIAKHAELFLPIYWNGRYWRRVYSKGKKRQTQFYRRYCNKKVRQQKGEIGNGGIYKKYSDYVFFLW